MIGGKIKRFIGAIALTVLLFLTGCYKDDIKEIRRDIDDIYSQLAEINTNISSIQVIVNAVQNNDYVTSVTNVEKDGRVIGYTISFKKSKPITIYHGQNGKDGVNGQDGKPGQDGTDGQDGHTPKIGVKQDADGIWYWTLDGEWLLNEDGEKIQAEAQDGQSGQNGTDGITPQLKIVDGYWYISYDNGEKWTKLGKATGEDGKDGLNGTGGDSFFSKIETTDPSYIIFILSDGTVIKLPTWKSFETLQQLCNQMNTNITSLQTIVNAMQVGDYIKSVTEISEGGKMIGYKIVFDKKGEITILNGKDGQDGAAGQDGTTPQISVEKDVDGVYYWTIDGEWLLDNGKKVPATGKDGVDGKTPQFKIENGYWFVSYNDGQSWTQLGKATGDKGEPGEPGAPGQDGKPGNDGKPGTGGNCLFSNVVKESNGVKFVLSDGTEFKVPLYSAALTNQIRSIIYIPEYSDGIAEVKSVSGSEKGKVTLQFKISPASAIGQLDKDWRNVLKLQAFKTLVRSSSMTESIEMPILDYRSNPTDGTILITGSGRNLSSNFYSGKEDASAILEIVDNAGAVSSNKVSLTSKVSKPNPPTPPLAGKEQIFTVKGVKFKMIKVEGGTFMMGSTIEQDTDSQYNESPVHQVTLSDYWIGETEVTQELWVAVMGSNPSWNTGNLKCPVEQVSWIDVASEFLPKLNALTGLTFSLPTEAQWEFAARGGTKSKGYKYSGSNNVNEVAWHSDNSRVNGTLSTHPVGSKIPNELGLYDMSGNVWEWCRDRDGLYNTEAQTDPVGPVSGEFRILRGGSSNYSSNTCRVCHRENSNPDFGGTYQGFRLVLTK